MSQTFLPLLQTLRERGPLFKFNVPFVKRGCDMSESLNGVASIAEVILTVRS